VLVDEPFCFLSVRCGYLFLFHKAVHLPINLVIQKYLLINHFITVIVAKEGVGNIIPTLIGVYIKWGKAHDTVSKHIIIHQEVINARKKNKTMMEQVKSTMMYLIYWKNFCKCHNVPLAHQ
jgi:hypothetical protein